MKEKLLISIFIIVMMIGVLLAASHTFTLIKTDTAINLNESCALWSVRQYALGDSPYSYRNFIVALYIIR